jgi:transposase
MPKAYSADMRGRVIAEVEGGASRREAAEEFEVSASTAIIWVKCFRETGRCAAKPRGGSISPLEQHADFLLGLIEQQPDLTLDEVVLAMRKHKIPGSRWRFFQRRDCRQYQDGAAERPLPARRAPDRPRAAGTLEDDHLCGRTPPQWHASAVHD